MVDSSRPQQLISKDLWGRALLDYHLGKTKFPLVLHSSFSQPESVPLEVFFRDQAGLSDLEVFALELCDGPILDVGAGAGCHSLILQDLHKSVTALECSAGACEVMRLRGVRQVMNHDIFNFNPGNYQTALMLMNGLGIAGHLNRITDLLESVVSRLAPGGQILADSSDIKYLYKDQIFPETGYYGELSYTYEYNNQLDRSFPWLFIDRDRLDYECSKISLKVQIIFEEDDQYLARITR